MRRQRLGQAHGPTERFITKQIEDLLRMVGAWTFKVHGHLGQRPGIPDIIACLNGQLIAIEVKTPKGKLSARQASEIEAIRAAGGIAFVARSPEEVYQALEREGFNLPFRLV